MQAPMPLRPGDLLFHNLAAALFNGPENVMAGGRSPALMLMVNSIIMSLAIAVGKIAISLLSAFAIVYFRFPLRSEEHPSELQSLMRILFAVFLLTKTNRNKHQIHHNADCT